MPRISTSVKPLTTGWSFRQLPSSFSPSSSSELRVSDWLSIESVPTDVHVELIKRKIIEDPNKGLNEWDCQWVGEGDWEFQVEFELTEEELGRENVDLVCEGLDTYCTIKIDDLEIATTSNMFLTHRLPLPSSLLTPARHLLTLTFPSTYLLAKSIESQQLSLARSSSAHKGPLEGRGTTGYDKDKPLKPQGTAGAGASPVGREGEEEGKLECWNGDSSRMYVRKAQYHWGWDWGPVLMTVGPFRPISIHSYTSHLTSLHHRTTLLPPYTTPSLHSTFTATPFVPGSTITQTIVDSKGKTVRTASGVTVREEGGEVKWDFKEGEVGIWWPVGSGEAVLYEVKVELFGPNGNLLSSKSIKIGFRSAEVIQAPLIDQPGSTFLFSLNGQHIFSAGSNWIPATSFLSQLTPALYRRWLELLVKGNQNMIRVWGGGIYENEEFYEICDELGIMVWQDFGFGCGQYPAHKELLKSVKEEAEQVVERLRNHCSVVIFAGNNEDYPLAESFALTVDYSDTTSSYLETNFPARHIYERLLPSVVNSMCDIYYHPGSPFGPFEGKDSNSPLVGDIHQWNVWHGTQEPWSNWDKLSGRFISEFGMQGYPNIRTVDYWLDGATSERFPQSRTNCSHNKARGFERRLELYLMENFRHAFDMESYVYYTQVMQAETLAAAYRLWRREWRGKGREYVAGALVWQLNDCWPVTSWSLIDFFFRPKPAFFAVARELKTYTVGMARKDIKKYANPTTESVFTIEQELQIWGTNSSPHPKSAKLEILAFDLHGGEISRTSTDIMLVPNSSTEFSKGLVPGQPIRTSEAQVPKVIVMGARLVDEDGTVLARYANWPEPWKYIVFPDPSLTISVDGEQLTLSCSKPIKGIVLDVDGDDVEWSDQAIDLMPGDEQVVVGKGLGGRKIKARFLGDGSA